MKAYLTTHLAVALHALIIMIVVSASAWYIDYSRDAVEQAIYDRIENARLTIIELASITDRNGADALTERIITDCPRRSEFEGLLNRLGTASRKELIVAQQLFESCGAFYAERKALMTAQLEREFRTLESDLVLMSTLRDLTTEERAYYEWNALVLLERERSEFLTEQTTIQSEIIVLLIEGGSRPRIEELANQAENIAQSLVVIDTQIDTLRAKLTS